MKLVHSFSLLCALVNIGSGAAANANTGSNIRKLAKTSDNKSAKAKSAKSAKAKSAKAKSVKINRLPKSNSKTLKAKKTKAPKLPTKISLLDCPSVPILSKSSTKDPLPSDALSVGLAYDHLKVYAEEDGKYSVRGCGAIVDSVTGARKAIMCHSGAVLDETGILPSITYMQLTTCSGTHDMVTDLHVRVDRATSTFNLIDTQAQVKVLRASSAFRFDVGLNVTFNYAGLAVSHPVVKERESDKGRSLAVSVATGTVFTVDKTKLSLSTLGSDCISPSTSEYSFVKVCPDSFARGVDDKKIFCSEAGYTRCMGAGLSVGNKGVCFSLTKRQALTGAVTICCTDAESCLKVVKTMVKKDKKGTEEEDNGDIDETQQIEEAGKYDSFTEDAPNTDSAVSVDLTEESFTFDQVYYANDYAATAPSPQSSRQLEPHFGSYADRDQDRDPFGPCAADSTCNTNLKCGCAPACLNAFCQVCEQGCTAKDCLDSSCACSTVCLGLGAGGCPLGCSPASTTTSDGWQNYY